MNIYRARPLRSSATGIRTATTALLQIPGPFSKRPFSQFPQSQSQSESQLQQGQPQEDVLLQSTADAKITTLPLLQSLRKNPLYKESRPHLTIPPATRRPHLVAGSLTGPEMITVAPYTFTSSSTASANPSGQAKKSKVYSIFHAGHYVGGHPGYVHGGLLSVMFDEAFARCVSSSFKSGLGMTANLSVDYRKPALPDRVFVLYAETVDVQGRKAWTEGVLRMCSESAWTRQVEAGDEGLGEEDVVVAEGKSLFIEPKFAASMVPLYRG